MPEFSINHSITYVIKKTNCRLLGRHILLHMKITLVFTCDLGRRLVRPNLCTLYIHRVNSTGRNLTFYCLKTNTGQRNLF